MLYYMCSKGKGQHKKDKKDLKKILTNSKNCAIMNMFLRNTINKLLQASRKRYLMTTNEIFSAIMSVLPEGSTMVRKSKSNFIAVPTGVNEDGVMEYAKVAISTLSFLTTLSPPLRSNSMRRSLSMLNIPRFRQKRRPSPRLPRRLVLTPRRLRRRKCVRANFSSGLCRILARTLVPTLRRVCPMSTAKS